MRPHGAAQYPLHERLPHRLADARRTRRAARRQMRAVRPRGRTPRNRPLLRPLAPTARGLRRGRRIGRNGTQRHGQRQFRLGTLRHRLHRFAPPCRRRGGVGSDHGQYGRSAPDLLRRRCRPQNPRRLRLGSLFGRPVRRQPRRGPHLLRYARRRSLAAGRPDSSDDLHRRHPQPVRQEKRE